MAPDQPPTNEPGRDARPAPPKAEIPRIDLGPSLEPIAFAAGRYAAAVQRALQGTHAAQRVREDSTASLVLELAADGAATACRGWRYNFYNDGPGVHTQERFREQQGYRGTYEVREGIVELELGTDDAVCAPKRESDRALARSSVVKLKCVLAAPRGHASLTAPVLLCRWIDVATAEARAQIVPDLAPDGWMVLGSGNGLRIELTGPPPGARSSNPAKVSVDIPASPLGADAWEQSF